MSVLIGNTWETDRERERERLHYAHWAGKAYEGESIVARYGTSTGYGTGTGYVRYGKADVPPVVP